MYFNDFNPPIRYGATFDGDITVSNAGGSLYVGANTGIPFCTITSVGTSIISADVTLLSDTYVTNNRTAYLAGIKIVGTQNWTPGSGSPIYIKDGAGTTFATIHCSALKQNIIWYDNINSSGSATGGSIVLTSSYIEGGKATACKGFVANWASGTIELGTASGSPFYVTIWGVIK